MEAKEFFKNKKTVWVVAGSLLLAIFLSGLVLGMTIGFYKAKFSCDWGKNYEANFIRPPRMPHGPGFGSAEDGRLMEKGMRRPDFLGMDGRDFRNPHGVSGNIIAVLDNGLVIKDRDEKENTVAVDENTLIKRGKETIKKEDLKEGEKVVVLGEPKEDGSAIEAKLIRVLGEEKF